MDQFTQRMQHVTSRGGSIATDPAILSMHQDLTAMHLQLLQQIDDTQEKKGSIVLKDIYFYIFFLSRS